MSLLDQVLIPGVNVFDIDKNLMAKMFPISFLLKKYDSRQTCCSKLNTSFCNLSYITFDRLKVYTLDRWFVELFRMVFLKKNEIEMPTPYFENQQLTDCMCIMLYMIDLHLQRKDMNLLWKCNFFKKYKHLFTEIQQLCLFTLLSEIHSKNEMRELLDIYQHLFEQTDFLAEYKAIFFGSSIDEWCLRLSKLLDFMKSNNFQKKNSLDSQILQDSQVAKVENRVSEIRCPFEKCIFIPIQNTRNISDWLSTRRISKYNGLFLAKNFDQVKRCRGVDRIDRPLIIFGFSDESTCKYLFSIYNKFTFRPGNDNDFLKWLDEYFQSFQQNQIQSSKIEIQRSKIEIQRSKIEIQETEIEIQETEIEIQRSEIEIQRSEIEIQRSEIEIQNKIRNIDLIPILEFCNMQDFLLLLEMVLLAKKYRYFLEKNSRQINQRGGKTINLIWEPLGIQRWPFNLKVFSAYILFYLLAYHIYNKPRRVSKSTHLYLDRNLDRKFRFSWSRYLSNMYFKHVEFLPFYLPNYLIISKTK